ncbi:hypothetical protein A6R68_10717 [Neotoma lepida]|uniref:Armadillo repeat-containing domain-containing protein n=1 Tax=Neotoma lepida TaxID=56216 RepID=A0A1A6FW51_NEOLE|nr:hypothetical protein A6R68_10717 [Neotoma lepida]
MGWMAAGLMIGAGACYCMYKLTVGRHGGNKLEDEEEDEWDDEQDLNEEEADIWFDFTTMARPWSEDRDWDEPGAPGKKMFTEPTNAGFSFSHNVKRHLASLSVVGNGIPTPEPTVREKALCVPENPNTSVGNQGQIKMYIDEVCRETVLRCCKVISAAGRIKSANKRDSY